MTHIELIEKIRDDYKKEFLENPAEDSEYTKKEDVENFRKGMIYAYDYLIVVLKNGGEDIYEDFL